MVLFDRQPVKYAKIVDMQPWNAISLSNTCNIKKLFSGFPDFSRRKPIKQSWPVLGKKCRSNTVATKQNMLHFCFFLLGVVSILLLSYNLFELHYFLRGLVCVTWAKFFKKKVHILDETNLTGKQGLVCDWSKKKLNFFWPIKKYRQITVIQYKLCEEILTQVT